MAGEEDPQETCNLGVQTSLRTCLNILKWLLGIWPVQCGLITGCKPDPFPTSSVIPRKVRNLPDTEPLHFTSFSPRSEYPSTLRP